MTKDIKVAVFLYENEDGTYKGSLRVNGDYDVAKVASVFGGGGHGERLQDLRLKDT